MLELKCLGMFLALLQLVSGLCGTILPWGRGSRKRAVVGSRKFHHRNALPSQLLHSDSESIRSRGNRVRHQTAPEFILSGQPSSGLRKVFCLLAPYHSSQADGLHAAPQQGDCWLAALLKKGHRSFATWSLSSMPLQQAPRQLNAHTTASEPLNPNS